MFAGKRRREVVGVVDVRHRARADVVRDARVPQVALGRQQPGRRHVGELPRMSAVVAEQSSDQRLGLRVFALAEVGVADVALLVDQVLGRPVLVRVVVPGLVVVVLHDRIGDAEPLDGRPHVRRHMLEGELRRVHADDHEPLVVIRGVPRLQVGERAQAVDARVRPEVDEHDLARAMTRGQRLRVDPRAVGVDRRCDAVVGQAPLRRLARPPRAPGRRRAPSPARAWRSRCPRACSAGTSCSRA